MKLNRKGAIGALLDLYEQAISDLKGVIETIPDQELTFVFDPHATDKDCQSIQTILSHVVNSGYGYAINIHNLKENPIQRPEKVYHLTIKPYVEDLTSVFAFTEKVFSTLTDVELEQHDNTLKIKTRWGQSYDIEQMTEHAIIHILRHQRQIERVLRK